MLLLGDLVTTIGVELVRHLQHPEGNRPRRYQEMGDLCNNARLYQEYRAQQAGPRVVPTSLCARLSHRMFRSDQAARSQSLTKRRDYAHGSFRTPQTVQAALVAQPAPTPHDTGSFKAMRNLDVVKGDTGCATFSGTVGFHCGGNGVSG